MNIKVDDIDTDTMMEVWLIPGDDTRAYQAVIGCCPRCQERGLQEDHFACRPFQIPEGWQPETLTTLVNSEWLMLVSRPLIHERAKLEVA